MQDKIRPLSLDTATRLIVIAGAFGSVAVMALLGGQEWRPLVPVTAAATGGALLLARWSPTVAAWCVLPLMYCSAVVLLGVTGISRNAFQAPMIGAVAALCVSRGWTRGWALPARWRLPLAWWALVTVLAAAVVAVRELDFSFALLSRGADRLANSAMGGTPHVIIVWIAYVTAALTAGVLWLDSFFAEMPPGTSRRFRDRIILPLALSAVGASAVAAYQGLVDIYWASGHGWGGQGRAAGGLVDGDAFGSLAGFWTGLFVAIAASGGRSVAAIGGAGFLLSWVGLWASGSRMALVAGLLSTAGALISLAWPHARRHRVAAAMGAVLVAAGSFALLSSVPEWQSGSPLKRTLESLPEPTVESVAHFAEHQLWNRDAPFGTAFLWMLHDFPATGVGVGSFHTLYPDYAYLVRGHPGAPENAQSWSRHLLAELGVLGSVGWVWWVGIVAWLVLRPAPGGGSAVTGCAKAVLVAIAVVSAVSMPTQHVAVSLTVWPLIFWLVVETPRLHQGLLDGRAPSATAWRAVTAASVAFALLTLAVGWYSLRPPHRAVRANWTYSRGFFGVEPGDYSRWTAKHAVEVPHAPARWMRLGIGGGAPDIASHPVRVVVRRNGEQIVAHQLTDRDVHVWWIRVPQGPPRVMIEIDVDRTWSPADFGEADTRDLGVSVLPWIFADVPPRDARTIN